VHKYLRSIGFSDITTKAEEIRLLASMEKSPGYGGPGREKHEKAYAELYCELGGGMGVILHGYREEDGTFRREYYFPCMKGLAFRAMEEGYIRRHADQESFAVLSEEAHLGSALIFFLSNGIHFRERKDKGQNTDLAGYYLTGMASRGTILLPIWKTAHQIARINATSEVHNQMMEAAKDGDEAAMESLTLEDIGLYSQISRRMLKEDIYSIVDSCFMPTGVECDNYMVIGEITQFRYLTNFWSKEKVCCLQVLCNGLDITVCVNETDLLGEPQVGRRFKGDIWLQGYGLFMDEAQEAEF